MSTAPDTDALLGPARRYASDRSARAATRSEFEQLAALDERELRALVADLGRRPDPDDRALAALLAAHLPEQVAAEHLLAVFGAEQEPAVLAAAAEAAGSLPGAVWSQEIERFAHPEQPPELRRAAATALYSRDDTAAFDALLRLAYDPDPDARGWAAWALADSFPPGNDRDTALRNYLAAAPDSQLTTLVRRAYEQPAKGPPAAPAPATKPRPKPRTGAELVVLLVSANPFDTGKLALDEEVREITAGVRATPGRDIVQLRSAWAMRPRDLLTELNEQQPAVLHFAGHGVADGRFVFADAQGAAQPVSGEAIAAAIASAGDNVRVVVLNACFSARLAQKLTAHVDIAVGMDRPVGDRAARFFAQQFYSALGYGHSVGKAFDQAVAALMLEGTGEHATPQLVARDGVDPYELVLVDPKAARTPDPAADRAALAQRSDEHLAHLGRHAELPLGDGLAIERAVSPVIAQRAEAGPLLVLGAPGSGKSGALHRFVRDARTAGHEVVVLAADLLQASGRRGLSEELGLELDLVDVLAAWPSERPAYLVVDALDAVRGRESSGVLLDLIERVAVRAGRWRVVASVRSFDLRHNPELQGAFPLRGRTPAPADADPEFPHVRHVRVAGFSDDELAALEHKAPAIAQFLAEAPEPLHELARVPFNLRLVVKLLERADLDREELRSLRTRLELLDLYWRVRVRRGPGQDAREQFATRICEEAMALMRLQVPRRRLRAEAAQGSALAELLDEGVLVEVAGGPRGEESLGFAHNVLFDYAVHALLLIGDPDEVASTLSANEDLVLLARPSLVLRLGAEWAADPTRRAFWELALRLAGSDVPVGARIAAPALAIDEARDLADFAPLLDVLWRGEDLARFVLAHTVGARTTIGQQSRPLAGRDDLDLWAAIARELGAHVRVQVAYPLRLLVWGLWAEEEWLTDAQRDALGASARALLGWAWAQDPPPTTDVGVALDAVARTCATDPDATRALLVRVADPDRVRRYGSYELHRVAQELDVVTTCLPEVVEAIYAAAYEYEETSEEQTPFGGGQILRLTSTRRQDWQMVRYALGREYPKVLRADTRVGVRVLAAPCEHEARSWSRPGAEIEVPLGEATAVIQRDGSHYWDTHLLERDTRSMLNAFEERLAEAAAASDVDTVATIVNELLGRAQPAAIWRRVLRAAAREPAALAPWLVRPLTSAAFLSVEELVEPTGAFLPKAFEHLGADERQRIEQAVLALPDTYPAESREAAEGRRDQLLAPIPPQTLTTEPARARAAELAFSGEAPPPEQPFDFELHRGPPGEEEYVRARGIDPDNPANARLLELIKPVEQFVAAHSNSAPNVEDASAAVAAIELLRAAIAEIGSQAASRLADEAEAWLCEAAAALAWQTPLPVRERSVTLARELALAGAHAALPAGQPESLEQFDRHGPSWGMPSGRIDAARALLFLAREPDAVDEEILDAATVLAHDPHPAVRWSAAHWLGFARHADEERIWTLVGEIACEEPSANVLQALLRPIALFANDRPERALALAREIYEREARGERREALLRVVSSFLVEFWVWRGRDQGRALVDRWIADIADAAELARSAFFALRDAVTSGGDGADDTALRERAIGVFADLARAAGDEFHALDARRRAGDLDEQEQQSLRAMAELLDSAASELYFASGSYAEKQESERERLAPEVRQRFYREGAPIIEVLTGIGLPSIAHHVVETLAGFVELDPRGVLLQLGGLLEAGKSWGYQLESLAEGEFVRLVELYLASHRDLLMRDPKARAVLVASLESFLDAGWPSARRLLYGLDDMFR
jgi:CHAT domain-containing protein/HEAT repeat protein